MEHIQSIGFSLPMFSALVCLLMLVMFRHRDIDGTQRRLSTLMIWTYATSVLCWFGVILFVVDNNWFVWFNTVFFLMLMFNQVLLYKFVFSVTGTGNNRKFRKVHYIVPVVITATLGVWSLTVPYDVQYHIVETRGEAPPGYEAYTFFFMAAVPIFVIYNVIYPLLGLFRIRRFRREVVNYSADEQRASAGWLYSLIALILLSLPLVIVEVSVTKSMFFSSWLTVPGSFLLIFQYLIICYNLMSGNYVIIQPPEPEENEVRSGKPGNIERKRFEAYIKEKKPYLNPKLKITDMCADMGTNRSYLSSFINSEYGVNFSRYINRLRLDELDRIRIAPDNRNALGMEMVLDAGFSSYRSYLRVKNNEDADARRTVGF